MPAGGLTASLQAATNAAATKILAKATRRDVIAFPPLNGRLRDHSNSTLTTFVSDPEAPAASVTVTRIVKFLGKRMTYVWPALYVPWLDTLPVDLEPSPQSIVYDHGPLLFASLKLQLNESSRPVTAVWSGPAFTTGGEF